LNRRIAYSIAVVAGVVLAAVLIAATRGVIVRSFDKTPSAQWSIIRPKLPPFFEINDLRFEGGVGLALGHRSPNEQIPSVTEFMARWDALILRLDAGASEWREVHAGRGDMLRVSGAGGGVVYALGETYLAGGGRTPFLEKSIDTGATWRSLSAPPSGVLGVRFASDGRGWVWTTRVVFSTENDGQTWEEVAVVTEDSFRPQGLEPAFDEAGGAWLPVGASVVRVVDGATTTFRLPDGIRTDWISVAPDGSAWLVARMNDQGPSRPSRLYRLTVGREPEILSEISSVPTFLPERLHVGRDVALVAACDVGQGDQRPACFMLCSRDGGRSWTSETPAQSSTLTPIDFETDEDVWAYAEAGRLQRRTLAR
jgi:hypothetical protein